ncbi:junctional adhesion molecule B precursor [Triplophysa rosa]|uniref:Junctional adhesion molecule B n=1 Tax=Triplophysa rosa TaxID=992332 RepID=A0A9W8C9N0_TRIRA|nr:junctional adhesion molecule B precursor [Triplophysa rosa]
MILSLVLLVLIQSAGVTPVTVRTHSPIVEVQENSDAELSCDFKTERENNPRIEWKKKDKEVSFVYFKGHFTGPFQGRATIDGATVRLQRVTQADAGEYRCEVSAPLDSIKLGETNVTLKVLVPPHTPSCDVPSSALTGSQVELRCKDQHSIPPASYTWFKDKTALVPVWHANATYTVDVVTGVLIFQTVSRSDTGLYYCEAKNGVGSPKRCESTHMQIDDLNVPAVIAGVVVVCILVILCTFGVCYAHRQGYFSLRYCRSFWIAQCHGVAHISSQNLNRTEHM